MYSVLFVCTANQCRSPMAEAWFNHLAEASGLDIRATSAGILANTGIPATPDAVDVLDEHGVSLEEFRSRELTLPLLRQADRIVVMTKDHADQVRRLEPTVSEKTFMLSEFLGLESDIEDPIGMEYSFYQACFNGMCPAIAALLEDIDKVLNKRKSIFTRTITDFLDTKYSIVIGSDHGGYDLKNALIEHLQAKGIDVEDLGPHHYESGDDFPDFAGPVSKRVAESSSCAGILICKSGIGMSINANRFRNVRAALVKTPREASISRMHNCSNLLVAGGNDLTNQRLVELAETWLATPYSKEERHTRRLLKLEVNSDNNLIAIREVDPEVARYIEDEAERQSTSLELIASENFVSPAIRAAAGTILTNKYAEGYPGERWYSGCEYVDKIETLAIHRACKLFGAQAANVQPHSGTQANMTAYMALLEPGDTVLAMAQEHGGHLSHGTKINFSGRLFNFVHYGVDKNTEVLDYDKVQALAKEHSPRLIVVGASTYSRTIDFQRMRQVADDCGAFLMCDMSHIAGLVAANLHPSPVPYCDIITSTTHKTLRGPRGGLILCKREHIRKVNAQNFPGVQGGPLMHLIAAKAICFKEAGSAQFTEYSRNVVQNAADLAEALIGKGYRLVSGGTDNHQMTLDLSEKGISAKDAESALEKAGITVNALATPFDPQLPNSSSGIRIGTAAVTTRGMGKTEMLRIAHLLDQVLSNMAPPDKLPALREEVMELVAEFPTL